MSDDPQQEAAAVRLIEEYLQAADHTADLINHKADNVARFVDHLRGIAQFRKEQADRLKLLAEADERRAEALTNYMIKVLTTLQPEATKFSLPTHEIRSRRSQAIEITDELEIPATYRKVKVTSTVDKTAIKEAIKAGTDVPGAELITRTNWSIK
jgi:hypothetical protein